MKFAHAVLAFALTAPAAFCVHGAEVATHVHEMYKVLDQTAPTLSHPFALTGTVSCVHSPVTDGDSGLPAVIDDGELLLQVFILNPACRHLQPGDIVAVSGHFGLQKQAYGNEPYAAVTHATVLGHAPALQPTPRQLKDLSGLEDNLRLIQTSGTIIDYRPDEADPEFVYLILKDGPTVISVSVPSTDEAALKRLLDARVSVVGTFNRTTQGIRRYANSTIVTTLERITILTPPPVNVPLLERKIYLTPKDILSLDKRKADGEIIAVWQKRNLLLRDDDGRLIRVQLSRHNQVTPRAGLRLTAYGYPDTDEFNIILGAATLSPPSGTSSIVTTNSPSRRVANPSSLTPSNYGELLTFTGTLRTLPFLGDTEGRLGLDVDGYLVQLDASSCPKITEGLELDSTIEATGVCLLESNVLTLVLRQHGDITVLSRPPWLTPVRFLLILGLLATVLIVILIWNNSLRVLVERRGRELARKQAETIHARFKTAERTRLATELHDSVVQNLTGAALEIRAAQAALAETDRALAPHLNIALKTINSSRAELRNCIWDLRNQALEEKDIDEAIRLTLQPHAGKAAVRIRFAVPRRIIPDNEFHSILSIIRELVINAVRHGQARTVTIAGTRDANRILFSVSDDGCGFDPAARPGMEQGHFGLEGVSERAKALNGEVVIHSVRGNGTRVAVNIALSEELG